MTEVISNTKYKILTPTGFQYFSAIQKLKKPTIRFIFEDDSDCTVSTGHKFYIDGKILLSDDVVIGDSLYHQDKWYTKVVGIEYLGESDVYDLMDVSNGNLYYGNGILSHNCEFIGSSNTVIDGKTLERLMKHRKEPESLDMGGKLRIWEKPKQGATYVLGVDTSKGIGGDSSVIQVIKILGVNPIQMRQVAVWEDKFTDVYKFAEVVNKMSYYYNDGYLMVENNAEGSVVVQRLWWEYENQNLINTGGKVKDLGIRATGSTKPRAVLLMKKVLEDRMIEIYDERTVAQISDFQDLGGNKFGGVNINDDLVTSLYWAIYVIEMQVFDESFTFSEEQDEEDDFWGDFLSDWEDEAREVDWSWLHD